MKKNLAKSAAALAALLLLSKVLGFVRQMLFAYKFGTSYIVDAYNACLTLPGVLLSVYASGFAGAYAPVYTRIREKGEQTAFFNNVITVLTAASVLMAVLCAAFGEPLAWLLAPGFHDDAHRLLIRFIQIISLILPVQVIVELLSIQIRLYEDFVFENFCRNIVLSLALFAVLLLASAARPEILPAGYVVSCALIAALLWGYAAAKKEISYRPGFRFRNPRFLLLCRLAIPIGLNAVVGELNVLTDRIFASLLDEGTISAMSYAAMIPELFYALTSSAGVCMPRIFRCFAEGDREGGTFYLRKTFMASVYFAVPAAAGLFLFAKPVVAMLFQRGNFDAGSAAMTARCLSLYVLNLPIYSLKMVGGNALHANLQQSKELKAVVISVSCNIVLDMLLLRPLGYVGLVLATDVASALYTALVIWDSRKLGIRILERAQVPELLKICSCTAVSIVLAGICYKLLLPYGNSHAVLAAAITGVISYGFGTSLVRPEILCWLYEQLPEKLRVVPWMNR